MMMRRKKTTACGHRKIPGARARRVFLSLVCGAIIIFTMPVSANATALAPAPSLAALIQAALNAVLAVAGSCNLCTCEDLNENIPKTKQLIEDEHRKTRTEFIDPEFTKLDRWILNDVWLKYFPELFVNITHQLTVTALNQLVMIGAMIDAKNQLDTQRLFQELNARASKDYHSSVQMCSFATNVRSLAAADNRIDVNAAAMNRWAQSRHIGSSNAGGAQGRGIDQKNRFEQFRRRFCDASNSNGGLGRACPGVSASGGAPAKNRDSDIDFTRTVASARTLDLDFSNAGLTGDEENLFALASNLYDHNLSVRIPEGLLFDSATNQQAVLDVRSVTAKRSVAEQSLFTIAAMKTPGAADASGGSDDTLAYMSVLLKEMGLSPEDILATYGTQPSYYAQMEVLAKKIYQDPNFYTNLYDTPVNVERKGATLKAISLMQDFDTLNSYLRTEIMLSVILELEIMKLQENVKKKILGVTSVKKAG